MTLIGVHPSLRGGGGSRFGLVRPNLSFSIFIPSWDLPDFYFIIPICPGFFQRFSLPFLSQIKGLMG